MVIDWKKNQLNYQRIIISVYFFSILSSFTTYFGCMYSQCISFCVNSYRLTLTPSDLTWPWFKRQNEYIDPALTETSAHWESSLESTMEGISSYLQSKLNREHILSSGILKSSKVSPLKETLVNTTTVVIKMQDSDCPVGTFLHQSFAYCG